MFEGIPYTVLGLGDTNYDKFCFMGKAIDKRLNELGGKRLIDVYCADEATNLEEVVEAWKIAVMDLVKSFLPQDVVPSSSQSISDNEKVNDNVLVDDHDHNTTILVELVSEEIKNIEIKDIAITIQDNVSSICNISTGDFTVNITTMDPLSI
jgi:sulfite reductase alpha subunit-like flavoprotein